MTEEVTKRRQGFACLSPEQRRAVAAKGGRSVKPENRAYSRDPELARRSAIKGGTAPHVSRGGSPIKETPEVWSGRMISKIGRMARTGKSLIETRAAVSSELTIPAFREKCRRLDIEFDRTRPKA